MQRRGTLIAEFGAGRIAVAAEDASETQHGRPEMQCERIRKLISRWHRDEPGAERKAARRKCSKALAPILDTLR